MFANRGQEDCRTTRSAWGESPAKQVARPGCICGLATFIESRMNLQLENKLALVTGSTAGIGYAIAEALVAEGANVIVNGRTDARVAKAVKQLQEQKKGNVHGLAADLGTVHGVELTTKQFEAVDILVNNVGIFEPKPFEEIPDADWMKLFEVNVLSGVRLSRHYLTGMRKRDWGRIVFISSESAVQIPTEMIHYGMTKTAQIAVARGIAETTVGSGITVNTVLAGPTASEGAVEFVDRLSQAQGIDRKTFEQEFFRSVRPSSLLKRFAQPEEVAAMVAFLCSPLSSATNGAAVRADGGVIRAIL
jgi:NAD(P)-dependent dehydrogenase (short-subunit alcohol dehydrogenase family)